MKPRHGHGNMPHPILYEIISRNRDFYIQFLTEILTYNKVYQTIKFSEHESNEDAPVWNNGFLPGLDIVALYTMIAHYKPRTFIEIGSGNSTKVARKSIIENQLETKIISIDPSPRTIIDHLADEVVRQPLEKVPDYQFIIDGLDEGDILFIDNSHMCFPNSDVTVCFLELLPFLKKGVIVHVHDIYMPYDYPQSMCDRYYSEQYVLAAFVLANPAKYKPIFPGAFISEDKELSGVVSSIWEYDPTRDVEKHGVSFWMEIN